MALFNNLSTQVPVVYNGDSPVTLHLTQGGLCLIKGLITDTDRNPLPNVPVKLIRQGDQVSGELEDATTDSNGQYTFAPTYGNSTYRVTTSPSGYGSAYSNQFQAASGQTVQAPTLKIGIADAFVAGTVVDSKGNPVAGASLTDQDVTTVYTQTDQAGHFMLKNVPRGKTNVAVMTQDATPTRT
jgi:hypothetical protein